MSALQDKVILVTGASSGLGAETARLLTRQGATVFGIARDTERLRRRIRRTRRPHQHRRATPNAPHGVDDRRRLGTRSGRQPQRPFYLCRAALPHLLERGGNIINVSSIAGVEGQAYSAGYCAAKHGLVGLSRALAVEYTADRLRVNAICPGSMLTPQLEQFSAPENPNYDLIMRTAAPRGMMQPLDVANVIAFLASDAAAAIHGAVCRVDNGKAPASRLTRHRQPAGRSVM